MTAIQTKLNETLGFVDLDYKGYTFSEAISQYEILQMQLASPISTTIEYPMGDISKVYPIGSLIPLFNYISNTIRIQIRWKNLTGKSELVFLNSNNIIIKGSGISIKQTDWVNDNIRITIPPTAKYLVLKNTNGTTVNVESMELYSVQTTQPEGISPILLEKEKALKNAFKMFLFSKKGDYGRNISKGGPLDWILGKPLSTFTTTEIKTKLLEEIKASYYGLEDSNIEVRAALEEKKYYITINLVDSINKYVIPVSFTIGED